MENTPDLFGDFAEKMRKAGVSEAAIRAFQHSYESLRAGDTGVIAERSIEPIDSLPRLADLEAKTRVKPELLSEAVMLKLNGGLGTSMGLESAKSLLKVKGDLSFLDFIARQ